MVSQQTCTTLHDRFDGSSSVGSTTFEMRSLSPRISVLCSMILVDLKPALRRNSRKSKTSLLNDPLGRHWQTLCMQSGIINIHYSLHKHEIVLFSGTASQLTVRGRFQMQRSIFSTRAPDQVRKTRCTIHVAQSLISIIRFQFQ